MFVFVSLLQVSRLWWVLPSCCRSAGERGPHWPVVHIRSAWLWLLVPPWAESGARARLHVSRCARLLPSLSQHVLPARGAHLRPLLHWRRLHRLPLRHALHLPHLPHRRHTLPLPGAAHHLLRCLLHDGFAGVFPGLSAGGSCGV